MSKILFNSLAFLIALDCINIRTIDFYLMKCYVYNFVTMVSRSCVPPIFLGFRVDGNTVV